MEKNNDSMTASTDPKANENPYANGKGRAIIERLFRESREYREQIQREYQDNKELQKVYAEIKQKQKEADAKR